MAKLFSYLLLGDEFFIRSNVLGIFLDIISIDLPGQIFHFQPSKNSRDDSKIDLNLGFDWLFSFFLLRDELWVRSDVLEIFFKIISINRPEQIFHFHPSKNSRDDSKIYLKLGFDWLFSFRQLILSL